MSLACLHLKSIIVNAIGVFVMPVVFVLGVFDLLFKIDPRTDDSAFVPGLSLFINYVVAWVVLHILNTTVDLVFRKVRYDLIRPRVRLLVATLLALIAVCVVWCRGDPMGIALALFLYVYFLPFVGSFIFPKVWKRDLLLLGCSFVIPFIAVMIECFRKGYVLV